MLLFCDCSTFFFMNDIFLFVLFFEKFKNLGWKHILHNRIFIDSLVNFYKDRKIREQLAPF